MAFMAAAPAGTAKPGVSAAVATQAACDFGLIVVLT